MLQLLDSFPKGIGRGNVFSAFASGVTPAAYSATAQSGPLLWNGSNSGGAGAGRGVTAYLLAVGFGLTTAAAAAAVLGVTGNTGQTAAPGSSTAITVAGNLYLGNPTTALCTPYNAGAVTNAGDVFLPFGQIHTGALTVDTAAIRWIELGGAIVVPPGAWASVAASAVPISAVMGIGLIWAEAPN